MPGGIALDTVLIFLPNETLNSIEIPIVDNSIAFEPDLQFTLNLERTSTTGVELGANNATTIMIQDDDRK